MCRVEFEMRSKNGEGKWKARKRGCSLLRVGEENKKGGWRGGKRRMVVFMVVGKGLLEQRDKWDKEAKMWKIGNKIGES